MDLCDHNNQQEIFPRDVCLRRVDASCNMKRFYTLRVQKDLFGGANLVREWGRIGSPGRVVMEYFEDEGLAVDALVSVFHQKHGRGYVKAFSTRSIR